MALLEGQVSGQLQLGLFEAVDFVLLVGEGGWLAGKQGLELGQLWWFGAKLLIENGSLLFVCSETGQFLVFWGEQRLEVQILSTKGIEVMLQLSIGATEVLQFSGIVHWIEHLLELVDFMGF